MEKKELRRFVKGKISSLTAEQKKRESDFVCSEVLRQKEFIFSDAIFSYMALKNELDPLQISLKALNENKTLLLPVALPRSLTSFPQMDFYTVSKRDFAEQTFVKSSFGIDEPFPEKSRLFLPQNFAGKKLCAIVPALAFSKNGERLGRGGGYYDSWLLHFRQLCKKYSIDFTAIGVGFSVQIVDSIPCESYDQKVDVLLHST